MCTVAWAVTGLYAEFAGHDYDAVMWLRRHRNCLLAGVLIWAAAGTGWAEEAVKGSVPPLSAAQIVEQMQVHEQGRSRALKHYRAVRHYQVEYRGFSANVGAKMDVEVNYDIASGKSFRIVSQSGSGMLVDKVLKRAVDSEKEASHDKGATALTPANYKFHLTGSEMIGGRAAYVLEVEPHVASKFLYRGKIWVDSEDFAVAKIETQPSKSPSFWISRTLIQCTNAKAGEFWFPEKLRSETKVRVGGGAVLTIDYGNYEVGGSQIGTRAE
jgi:hypothetical protein